MKKEIQNCLTWLANKNAETYMYLWDVEYKENQIKKNYDIFYDELKKHIDFTKITVEEAKELRFQRWDDELPDLWLFPLYLVPIIPEGLEVIDIGGNKYPYEKETADNDIRFGCVPYGIEIKAEE